MHPRSEAGEEEGKFKGRPFIRLVMPVHRHRRLFSTEKWAPKNPEHFLPILELAQTQKYFLVHAVEGEKGKSLNVSESGPKMNETRGVPSLLFPGFLEVLLVVPVKWIPKP